MEKAQIYEKYINRKYVKNTIKTEYLYSAFETNYRSDFYFGGEFHQAWEFVYVISGRVGVSGDNRVYHLNEGDIIFHKPMEFHRVWAVDNIKPHLFIVSFQPQGKLPEMFENGVFSLGEKQKNKMLELLNYLKENSAFENSTGTVTYFLVNWEEQYLSQNVANRLEAFLLSVLEQEEINIKKEDTSRETYEYKKIITILAENVYSNITLSNVAQMCNISKTQLKRVFAAKSHIGVHKYFVKLKVAEAMKLLLEGMPVCEVAEKLGFSSSNYFSTVFKKETGISPLEYKRHF